MPRTVDRIDGLCLLGAGTIGPIVCDVPVLVTAAGPDTSPPEVVLAHRSSTSGRRALVLSREGATAELDVPVLAPEVGGVGPGVHPIGPGRYLVHAPFDVEIGTRLRSERPELLVLGNARALWNEGEPFVEAVRALRASAGSLPLLWAPRVALPHRVPFLAYLGVDLVDTTEGLLAAAEGSYFDPALGATERESARRERACRCAACAADPPGSLEGHTREVYRQAIRETRAAARTGRLRELVEARLTAEPSLAEMLRYADHDLARALEERTPVVGRSSRNYVLAESQRRPEIVRYRTRLLERYRPPLSKSVLLLVPCSKTKPYRLSRSHRRFATALEGLVGVERVHVVSVSSPLGLVPRELEDVHPARHYDIPVTGEWSEPERVAVLAGLDHLVKEGRYSHVVAHLDPEECRFLHDRLASHPTALWSISDGRTTTAEAITRLRTSLIDALSPAAPVPGGPLAVVREELREVASFQFGRDAAERLFAPPLRLAGRPWFQRLTDGRQDLATLREGRGLFHLTMAGARRLGPPYPFTVEVDPTLPLTGDLFVPGVRSADPAIRVGDSVVLLREGGLAAVGEAALPGPLMAELTHGLAVRVRHRERLPTDTAMTEEPPPLERGPVVQR